MHKGRLDQERQGIRSTKLQEPLPTLQQSIRNQDLIDLSKDNTDLLQSCNYLSPIEQRTTNFYFSCHEALVKFYTDPTGRFLVSSTKGNKYIPSGYDYDSNHVFAEPMKNRKKDSQIKAVTTIIKTLKAAGLRPTCHILDNEVSTDLISFLETNENITFQLAPAE